MDLTQHNEKGGFFAALWLSFPRLPFVAAVCFSYLAFICFSFIMSLSFAAIVIILV